MIEFIVNDMSCNHCVGAITKAVESAFPGATLSFDLAGHTVRIDNVTDAQAIQKVIAEAGYTPELSGQA